MDLYKYIYIEVSYYENGRITMDISPKGAEGDMSCRIELHTSYDGIREWCMEHDVIFNDFLNGVVYNDP